MNKLTRQERTIIINKIVRLLREQGEYSIGISWLERMTDDELNNKLEGLEC